MFIIDVKWLIGAWEWFPILRSTFLGFRTLNFRNLGFMTCALGETHVMKLKLRKFKVRKPDGAVGTPIDQTLNQTENNEVSNQNT